MRPTEDRNIILGRSVPPTLGGETMAYLKFDYQGTEVILTPDTIRDMRRQLIPQLKSIPFGELAQSIDAAGLSVKNLVALFKKVKEFGT